MTRLHKIILFGTALLSSPCTAAVYIHPEKLQSIANEAVYSVCQDTTGAIWLNTGYGICNFDGQRVRFANRSSLSRSIAYDGGSDIYSVSYYGILRFDIIHGSRTVLTNPSIDYRKCELMAEGDSLWVVSGNSLLVSRADSLFTVADNPDHEFTAILRRRPAELILGTHEGALLAWDGKGFTDKVHFHRQVSKLAFRPDSSLFVGFYTGGFAILSKDLVIEQIKLNETEGESLPSMEVRAFCELPDADALIGSADGLFRYTKDGRCIREGHGFPVGEPVWSIYRDREDNIWVGSFYNGLFFYDKAFDCFSSLLAEDPGIRQVSALAEDARGDIWIFTDNYGMYRVSGGDSAVEEIPGGQGIKFQSVYYDPARDGIWTGEFQGCLRFYDIQAKTWETYPFEGNETVNSIYRKNGILYLGTFKGCFVFDPSKDNTITRKLFPADRILYTIRPFGSNSLLLSGIGAYKYDIDTGTIEKLQVPGNCQDILSVGDTVYVCVTGNGLYMLPGDNERINILSSLPDSYISHICATGDGTLLLSSRSGLSLLGLDGKIQGIYNSSGGLGLSSLRGGCFLRRSDGSVLIGGKEGVKVYKTKPSESSISVLKPRFQGISVDNSERAFDKRLPFMESVGLRPGERNFSVMVGTFNYSSSIPSFWRYKLEGYDETWTTFKPSSPIIYMNIPAGNYKLVVQYDNTPAYQDPRSLVLPIRLRAQWYATKAAKALYILTALLFLCMLLYFLISKMMLRQRLQYEEQESQRRTKLFVDISRQLRTPLTLILGQLESFISRYGNSAPGMKFIESSYSNANSMSGIISGFVDLENNFEPVQMPHELHPDNAPAPAPASAQAPAEEHNPLPNRHETQMLIVSDNPEMRALLRGVFGDTYDLLISYSASEALGIALHEQPDIIVCDLMPDSSDELDLVERLRQNFETCHIPFVLITSHASEQRNLESVRSGVDAFIIKPFKTELLTASCRSLLENRRILREKYAIAPLENASPARRKDFNFLNAAIGAVERNLYSNQLNVSTLCSELNMSKTSLTGKLHALTNMSPREFIEDIRLRHAAEMLQDGRRRVSEVADELCFSSAKYFTIRFRKHFGKTPSAYSGRE